MTAKRFELKIPQDLLARIEDAARDYFQSPINHTSLKPELTSPILKLIEKGLEKIASTPDTDILQVDTDNLNELIDERIKAQLSVYKLDELQASIDNLQRAVFSSGNHPSQPVSNLDNYEIVTPDDIPESSRNGSLLFSVELDQTYTVEDTDTPSHHDHHREGEDKGFGEKKETLKSSVYHPNPDSEDSSKSVDLSGQSTQIEPVLNPDQGEISDTLESMDNHNTPERNSTDRVQAVSVEDSPNDDGNQKGIEKAIAVGTESVCSPDPTSNDTTQADGGLEKPKASAAKVTLKGAWKHALEFGFKGSVDEFRNLFKNKGDVHYGVKILYFSGAGSSRNYEKHG